MIIIPENQLKDILIKEGLIDGASFDLISDEAKRLKQNIAEALISKNIITDLYLFQLISHYFNVPLADLNNNPIDEALLKSFPESLARQKKAIIFNKDIDGSFKVAMENPADLETLEFLKQYLGLNVKPYLATDRDLDKGFALYGKQLSEDFKKIIEDNINTSLRLSKNGEEAAEEVPVVAIVDNIIAYAVSLRSSDIHLEIFEDGILIRYRIDGILHEIMKIPRVVHQAVVARIKILSSLKIDEHYKPQDGRFRYKIGDNQLDIRVAIMPTFNGEKIVMRLLTAAEKPLSFQEVGMLDYTANIVSQNVKKSFGMVLVCGPTGSGKTTTLYSILNILNKPEVNIATIEDPIEYNIKYINQTQINPAAGVTFASSLRAFLRQDPNIIFVGEIRDGETADIATQAALTGHLVLSSLHTNDAPTAIPRLLDMGVPAFLVSAVLNAVIAQRLVRKICLDCIYSLVPDPNVIETLRKQMDSLGLGARFHPPKFIYAGKGCPSCGGTGYRGRVAIFEALDINDSLRKIIISPNFSVDELKMTAYEEGMMTMLEDGLQKVEKGMTTVEELLRVIRE